LADVATTFLLGAVATFVPLFLGLTLPTAARSLTPRKTLVMSAISAGIIFWFFLDVMGDSTLLGVNQGFRGGYTHVVLVLVFALGFASLFLLEGPGDSGGGTGSFTYRIAAIVALGIGFHAFGEGMDIGSVTSGASSIIDAIGGLGPGTAYVLHKVLEGFVIGVFASLAGLGVRKIALLGIISGVPTVLGFFVGLPGIIESTYFFALGGAAVLYVEMKLIPSLQFSRFRSLTITSLLAGFYLMYFAGLLHS
jgi:zinc transporter ZupT